jgi:hypothetical protein
MFTPKDIILIRCMLITDEERFKCSLKVNVRKIMLLNSS